MKDKKQYGFQSFFSLEERRCKHASQGHRRKNHNRRRSMIHGYRLI